MNNPKGSAPPYYEREQVLFIIAVAKPAANRATFLDVECAGDSALRTRLEALLAAHEQSEGVLAESGPAARRP